jgi:DNA-directed RNA polymerase specialized sigma24 family protein
MAYVDGMKNEEIAETLSLPQSTVRNQKARGLVALKKSLPDGVFSLLAALIGI